MGGDEGGWIPGQEGLAQPGNSEGLAGGDTANTSWAVLGARDHQLATTTILSLLLLLLLLSLTVNISLLLVFARKESLRTTSNTFVINLLAVNVTSCLVLLPLVALDSLPSLLPSLYQCQGSQASLQAISSLSLLSSLLVGWDQYLAVLRPLRYHHHMTRTIASVLIVVSWAVSLLSSLLPLLLSLPSPFWSSCSLPSPSLPSLATSLSLSLTTLLLPSLLLTIIYYHIYSCAHTSSLVLRKSSLMPALSGSIYSIASSGAGPPPLHRPGPRPSLPSLPSRPASTGQFLHWEEGRAAAVCLASLGALLLCWGPLASLALISDITGIVASLTSSPSSLSLPPWTPPLLLLLCLLYSLLSPFIFAFRHYKIRHGLFRLWGVSRPPHYLAPLPGAPRARLALLHYLHRAGRECGALLEEGRASSDTSCRSSFSRESPLHRASPGDSPLCREGGSTEAEGEVLPRCHTA